MMGFCAALSLVSNVFHNAGSVSQQQSRPDQAREKKEA